MSRRIAFTALAIGILGRLFYAWWSPVTYDEAYTHLAFVSQPLLTAVGLYNLPNNHPLNSLLAWLSTRLLPGELMALRLPSLLFGIGVLFLGHRLFSRLMGPAIGALVTLAIAVSSPIVFYSTQARGYSGQLFFFLLLLTAVFEQRPDGLIVFAAVLALWSVPTAVYGVAAVFLFLLASGRMSWRPVTRLAMRTAAWTGLLYLPVFVYVALFGTRIATDERTIDSLQSAGDYALWLVDYFASSAVPGLNIAWLALYLLFPILAFRKNRELFWLWICLTLGPPALILLSGVVPPYERTWLWLAPFFIACALQAALYAVEGWGRAGQRWAVAAVLVLALAPMAARTVDGGSRLWRGRTRTLEYVSMALHDVVQPGDILGLPESDLTTLDYYSALDPQGRRYLSTRRYPLAGGWEFALARLHGPVAALREPMSPQMKSRIFTVQAQSDHREDLRRALEPFGLGGIAPAKVPHAHGDNITVWMVRAPGS